MKPTASDALLKTLFELYNNGERSAIEKVISEKLTGEEAEIVYKSFRAKNNGDAETVDYSLTQVHRASEAFMPRPKTEWHVEGLCAVGSVNILSSDPGIGKSWSMLNMAACCSAGINWMGRKTKKTPVLWVDAESGEYRHLDRLEQVLTGSNVSRDTDLFHITPKDRLFNLREDKDIQDLKNIITANKCEMCFIDALADIMPGADENNTKDTLPVMLGLRQLSEQTGATFWILHHLSKAGTVRGSTAIPGAVDLAITITKSEDGVLLFKSTKTRDTEPIQFSAMPNWTGGLYTLTEWETQKTIHMSKPKKFVMDYLREHGNSSITDIMDAADSCTPQSARQAVYSLVDDKIVYRTNPGNKGEKAFYNLV